MALSTKILGAITGSILLTSAALVSGDATIDHRLFYEWNNCKTAQVHIVQREQWNYVESYYSNSDSEGCNIITVVQLYDYDTFIKIKIINSNDTTIKYFSTNMYGFIIEETL